jgi:phage repressor protein C with HTH and peptisase S24 domain
MRPINIPGMGNRLKELREARRWTHDEAATKMGISRSGYIKLERGERRLADQHIQAAARAFGIAPAQVIQDGEPQLPAEPEPSPSPPRTRGQTVTSIIPGEDLEAFDRKMPVYSGAQGGSGKLIISYDIVDRVKMPVFLENVSGAYGLLVDGSSMVPAFHPGDTVLVNPHLKPQRGRNVILYHTPPNGDDAEAIVKQLNGWNDREWDLEQFNPPLQFKEHRAEWPICHRIVGKYDAT